MDESDDKREDYSDSSILRLDMVQTLFHRVYLASLSAVSCCRFLTYLVYCSYSRRDSLRIMGTISRSSLGPFFDLILNKHPGMSGRRLAGLKSANNTAMPKTMLRRRR